MKSFLCVTVLVGAFFVSEQAFANAGAAINRKTGKIIFMLADLPRATLVKEALKSCRKTAAKAADCVAAKNTIGVCENPAKTQAFYGATAGHFRDGGWRGYISCGKSQTEAREFVLASCGGSCITGHSFFDDTQEVAAEE